MQVAAIAILFASFATSRAQTQEPIWILVIGAHFMLWFMDFPEMTGIRLFAEDVLPRFGRAMKQPLVVALTNRRELFAAARDPKKSIPVDSASSSAMIRPAGSMALSAGSPIGSYEILALIGSGGMGTVYRARDRKLRRDVAIKVLPDAFSADVDRLARFQREALVLASLNHPNIAAIYDIQEDRGVRYLVLELCEGVTLAARLKRGPLPLDEALELLKQVAEALEAAHEKGVLHRDLKPANIQITPNGLAKILDFGLAKIMQPDAASADASNSPTLSAPHTAGGAILGTAAYMSPEQARGRAVDRRTDVWAFGCVMYEVLTGEKAFAGETVADILASVMNVEPDWSRLPPATPSAARSLLRQCLQKQVRRRLQEIADARIAIEDAMTEPQVPQPHAAPPVSKWRGMAPIALLLVGVLVGWLATRSSPIPASLAQVQMSVEPADRLDGSIASVRPSRTAFAISPDGRLVVFSGMLTTTPPQLRLYRRELAQSEATPIPGTEGGFGPFFSPDGDWIGFYSGGYIKKVPVDGGPPVVLCEVSRDYEGLAGATWSEDGTLYFSDRGTGISKVSSAGGTPVVVTTSDLTKGERHLLPQAVPGGRFLTFTVLTGIDWEKAHVVLQALDTGERRILVQGGADARFVQTGHLIYMKMGTLMAVPFDVRKLQVLGEPVPLVEGVMQAINHPNTFDETGAGQFATSRSGTLLYVPGGMHPNTESKVVSVDRKGVARPLPFPVGPYFAPRLSPDEDRVALSIEGASGSRDVWVYDALRGAPTRLTFGGKNIFAVWSPDGKELVFASNLSGVLNLHLVSADASGSVEKLTTSEHEQVPSSWTAQGNLIAFVELRPSDDQIWVLPMDSDRKPVLFLQSRFKLADPEFSPDGRWMAYASEESGTQEVYVQPYPGPGGKYRVSTDGGREPVWVANGGEILYRTWQEFYSVAIASLHPFRAEAPRLLFTAKPGEFQHTGPVRGWDASRDGQSFLLFTKEESKDKPVTQIQVVLNWTEELKRRVPVK